jgi:hypothetical protein
MLTPSCSRHERVEPQSSAVEKFDISEFPIANPAIKATRWEIDLSPGTAIRPAIFFTGSSFISNCLALRAPNISLHAQEALALGQTYLTLAIV